MSTAINTVNSNATNINAVGGAITNVNNVGGSIASVNTVATNLASVNSFANTYLGASGSAPTQDPDGSALDVGDLYFDTGSSQLKVYSATGWVNAGSSVNGTSERFKYTISGTPTTVSGNDDNSNSLSYDAGFIDVFLNGIKMVNGTDVTVTSGNSVVFASALTNGDVVDIITFGTFNIASMNASNLTSGTVPDARITGAYTGITNLTMSGDLTVDTNTLKVDSTNNRVGIGNSSPTGALDVKSSTQPQLKVATASATAERNAGFLVTANNSATAGSRYLKLSLDADGGDGSGTDNLTITKTGGSGDATITNESNANIVFGTNNTEIMRLTSTGLGIGTSSPISQAKLTISPDNTQSFIFLERLGTARNDVAIGNDGGKISFRTGGDGWSSLSSRMDIDSSGNVGIGETAPLGKLHVKSADSGASANSGHNQVIAENSGNSGMTILSGNTSNGAICFGDDGNNCIGYINYAHNGNHLDFGVNASEKMRIDSSGNVGIGTTSPNVLLHLSKANGERIKISNSTTSTDAEMGIDATGAFVQAVGNTSLRLRTNGSEAMRIDSSGNVLINTTDASTLTAGIKLRASDNAIAAVATSNPSGYFGRLSTNGDIVKFRKDSATVGSIGVNGDNLVIDCTSSDHTGLDFANDKLIPRKNSSASDNGVDLGYSGGRFKDLYLGGGLYVGGTGSANNLDDYEEGDWTPTITLGTGSHSLSGQYGSYTKIGRVVYFTAYVVVSSVSSPGGELKLASLPFTSSNANKNASAHAMAYYNWQSGTYFLNGETIINSTSISIYNNNNGGRANAADKLQAGSQFHMSGFYYVS
jgi:hypothetical protein